MSLIRPRTATRHGRRKRTHGQAVVEFALILPVFLLFTLGVVDMARVFTAYIALTNGVSNGAIYASQGTNYLNWCASGSTIGGAMCTTVAQNKSNPDNIAYQVQIESSGLVLSGIAMPAPLCTPTAGGAAVTCSASSGYSSVQVGATYSMSLMTPLMSNLMGGPIRMASSTTAAIIQ